MENRLPTIQTSESKISALREVYGWYQDEPRSFIEHNLLIKTKSGELKPLAFNSPQLIIYGVIQRIKQEGKPIRIIVPKARREGVSTLAEALIFHRTVRKRNTHSLVIAHDPETTDEIFSMSKLFYDGLPRKEKPLVRYNNKKQLVFENPDPKTRIEEPGIRSKMTIATADKVKIGRGLNIHCFHASEVAFWKDAKTLMLAALQAVPDLPDTIVIVESTANGVAGTGKYFYDFVQEALENKNDFQVIFLPWFLMPEYERAFASREEKEKFARSLDAYEKWLPTEMAKYGISDPDAILEKLNWRRWAIPNKAGGSAEDFKQEYPATLQEAFIASTNAVIPKELIEAQRKFIRKPLPVQAFAENRKALALTDAGVEIYELPQKGHFYSLGADSAEGEGGDDGALTVFSRRTGREVASFASDRLPPEELAKLALNLAMYFNNALIVPEINHPGPAMLAVFKKSGYPNIYRREVIDKITNAKTRKLGWRTNSLTKPMMVQDFKQGMREEEIGLSCESTVNQMLTFIRTDERGLHGMGAENGDGAPKENRNKDDRLISAMLAWQGMKELPAR
ncbi:hypothetical protein EPO34_03540 [Patescibacteria group bacterium]|nr:MAG: hypothetical protein EPO34_03540 [Patescibacteria group bacterium]